QYRTPEGSPAANNADHGNDHADVSAEDFVGADEQHVLGVEGAAQRGQGGAKRCGIQLVARNAYAQGLGRFLVVTDSGQVIAHAATQDCIVDVGGDTDKRNGDEVIENLAGVLKVQHRVAQQGNFHAA